MFGVYGLCRYSHANTHAFVCLVSFCQMCADCGTSHGLTWPVDAQIPRADGKKDKLGLSVLDEPASQQTDPTGQCLCACACVYVNTCVPVFVYALVVFCESAHAYAGLLEHGDAALTITESVCLIL
jgi:hypothetical protein